MKVFISWSGPLGEKLGQSIRDWLPNVIQSVDPYFTPSDVDKGTRWLSEITRGLNDSMVGILCVTRENISSEWLLFEAGALSTKLDKTHVCPILFGIKPTDLSGPLKQFQATNFNGGDFRKLINTINSCLGEQKLNQKTLDAVFEKWWPDLENEIKGIFGCDTSIRRTDSIGSGDIGGVTSIDQKRNSARPRIKATYISRSSEGFACSIYTIA